MNFKNLSVVLLSTGVVMAQTHIRWNQAGYQPNDKKSMVVFSNEDLKDKSWKISLEGTSVLEGNLSAHVEAKTQHTSHDYYHTVDFSSIDSIGQYVFEIETEKATIDIKADPYSVFITDALRHLRESRSGSDQNKTHGPSHLLDSAAIQYVTSGPYSEGLWEEVSPKKTYDALGGWYDAGDYIKFTLTTAHTVYYLLEAYEANPKAFTKVLSPTDLIDVLDEAKHGLDYLAKLHPEPDVFIIQVGNNKDHHEGKRMPTADQLDGKRPALTAISPVHMGLTAAALAKGAKILGAISGYETIANEYLNKAKSIYARAEQGDALSETAYEMDATNPFYRDETLDDNMAIGAVSLYEATLDESYKTKAEAYDVAAAQWMAWGTYNPSVHQRLAALGNSKDATTLATEMSFFTTNSKTNVWGIPTVYTWAPMLPWLSSAALAGTLNNETQNPDYQDLQTKMVDYLFGRNNWGVSMIASPRLPNTIENIYSTIYELSEEFPVGAISEGPGDRVTHESLSEYLPNPDLGDLAEFNTSTAVFTDNENDFMIQETVTMLQSLGVWMLAVAYDSDTQAIADSSLPTIEKDTVVGTTLDIPVSNWYIYSDKDEGGNSIVLWEDKPKLISKIEIKEGIQYPYAGIGLSFGSTDFSKVGGIRVKAGIPVGQAVKFSIGTSLVTDYDFHAKSSLGKGLAWYEISFNDLAQGGFGKTVAFDRTKITEMTIGLSGTPGEIIIDIEELQTYEAPVNVEKNSIQLKSMLQEIDGVYYVSLPHPMEFSWYSLDGKKLKAIYLKKGRQKLTLPDEKGPVILKMGKRSLKLIL